MFDNDWYYYKNTKLTGAIGGDDVDNWKKKK
jgi:hypothetical protein